MNYNFNADELFKNIDIFSEFIFIGKKDEAFKIFNKILDNIEQILAGISDNTLVNNLLNILTQLLSAFENADYVLMNDLLLYEIKPIINKALIIKEELANCKSDN